MTKGRLINEFWGNFVIKVLMVPEGQHEKSPVYDIPDTLDVSTDVQRQLQKHSSDMKQSLVGKKGWGNRSSLSCLFSNSEGDH